jgi:hypothetical protein
MKGCVRKESDGKTTEDGTLYVREDESTLHQRKGITAL